MVSNDSIPERATPTVSGQSRSRPTRRWRPYVWLAPTAILFIVFLLFPIGYTVYLSFLEWNLVSPTKTFVGLANYVAVFTDPTNLKVLSNTLWFTVLLVALNFCLPYIAAFVLEFVIKRGKQVYKILFYLPSVVSLVVASLLFTWLLNPVAGPVAQVFHQLGWTLPQWSQSSAMGITVLCLVTSWKVFGYNFIVLLAGLANVPTNVVENARIDNVPNWRIMKDIVMPMNRGVSLYVLVVTIVQGLQYVFTPINVMTQGMPDYGTSNIIYHAYLNAFVLYKTGTAAALSTVTLLFFMVLLLIELRYVEGWGRHDT